MDIEELKKDVEVFIKGVGRLEQLKAEFERIDTSGYEKEAEEIRSMLKNVSAIPELEVKIARLKAIQRKNGLKYKYRNASPPKVEKQIQITESKSPKENKLLEEKYKYLIEQNNNKIFNEINSIKKSVNSLVNALNILKTQMLRQEKKPMPRKTNNQSKKIKVRENIKSKETKKIKKPSPDKGQTLSANRKYFRQKQKYFDPEKVKAKDGIIENRSRNFFKCHSLLLKAEKALQNEDKLRAEKFYSKANDIYTKMEYLEKKKIYNELLKLYNRLNRINSS